MLLSLKRESDNLSNNSFDLDLKDFNDYEVIINSQFLISFDIVWNQLIFPALFGSFLIRITVSLTVHDIIWFIYSGNV